MKIVPDKNHWFDEFLAGNNLAFNHYFDEHYQPLFHIAYKIVQETSEAEDIVADCFAKLWEYRGKIRSEEHMAGFLRLVARNLSLNHKKRDDRKTASEDEIRYLNSELDSTDLARDLVEAEMVKNIHKAVERLPRKCKAVFKLIFFEQATTKEAAEQLGISERNVLNQKTRAIALLKGIFSG